MSNKDDILQDRPDLQVLRDRLLARDEDARLLGRAKLSRILYSASLHTPLPPDRVVDLETACYLTGFRREDFELWVVENFIFPVRQTARKTYYRAGEIEAALKRLR